MPQLIELNKIKNHNRKTHISDDFGQAFRCASGVADALHSRKQIRRRITQKHADLMCLTSAVTHADRNKNNDC